MIALPHTIDYVVMILVAAGIGAIGGLGAELLIKRSESTGTIEIPHKLKGTNLVALGFPASILVGAIAAVAVLYFFPPVTETIAPATATMAAKTTREYNLVKLVPLALIVGSAGPAFLATAQSRLMSALSAQKAEAVAETARNQIAQVTESAKAAVPGAVRQAVAEAMPDATAEEVQSVADRSREVLDEALRPQVDVAQGQIDAVAPGDSPPASGTHDNGDPGP
jgi:hypothetical protein